MTARGERAVGQLRRESATLILVALLSSCAGPASVPPSSLPSAAESKSAAGSSQPTASPVIPSEPVGVAVIGHSGATGYNTDPDEPDMDLVANSWATGTNPAVQSIYLRMLVQDPTIEGHATNLAIDGSTVSSLIAQATQLVGKRPAPTLVLVQTIDNDMKCDGTDEANFGPYRSKLTEAIGTLSDGLPDALVFIVSQWADVATYDRVIAAQHPEHLSGVGPCDTVDPDTGRIVPSKEKAMQRLVDAYWAIVTKVCAEFANCRTDGGAMQAMDLEATDLSFDLDHLSVAGHAKMAEIVWGVLNGEK